MGVNDVQLGTLLKQRCEMSASVGVNEVRVGREACGMASLLLLPLVGGEGREELLL